MDKSIREFIKEHREDIDAVIWERLNDTSFKVNDEERRLWILNDEGLYNWAKEEGCDV